MSCGGGGSLWDPYSVVPLLLAARSDIPKEGSAHKVALSISMKGSDRRSILAAPSRICNRCGPCILTASSRRYIGGAVDVVFAVPRRTSHKWIMVSVTFARHLVLFGCQKRLFSTSGLRSIRSSALSARQKANTPLTSNFFSFPIVLQRTKPKNFRYRMAPALNNLAQ